MAAAVQTQPEIGRAARYCEHLRGVARNLAELREASRMARSSQWWMRNTTTGGCMATACGDVALGRRTRRQLATMTMAMTQLCSRTSRFTSDDTRSHEPRIRTRRTGQPFVRIVCCVCIRVLLHQLSRGNTFPPQTLSIGRGVSESRLVWS